MVGSGAPETTPEEPQERLAASTRAELAAVGRLETAAGQAALLLAERLDAGRDTGQGLAALTREWRVTMAQATADARVEESELDKLRRLRAGRLGA